MNRLQVYVLENKLILQWDVEKVNEVQVLFDALTIHYWKKEPQINLITS